VIADDWIARVKARMPELPAEMKARFAEQYLLYAADAAALTATRATAEYFTQTMDALAKTPGVPYSSQGNDATNGKVVANWVINELGALLNNHQTDIADAPIAPQKLAELIAQTDRFKGTISHKAAKDVLAAMWSGEGDAVAIIAAKGLRRFPTRVRSRNWWTMC
jgi:aspartyl-tRNA(Asn)/glutamyl-tRNA(Gln) amidotransferase subunit B